MQMKTSIKILLDEDFRENFLRSKILKNKKSNFAEDLINSMVKKWK